VRRGQIRLPPIPAPAGWTVASASSEVRRDEACASSASAGGGAKPPVSAQRSSLWRRRHCARSISMAELAQVIAILSQLGFEWHIRARCSRYARLRAAGTAFVRCCMSSARSIELSVEFGGSPARLRQLAGQHNSQLSAHSSRSLAKRFGFRRLAAFSEFIWRVTSFKKYRSPAPGSAWHLPGELRPLGNASLVLNFVMPAVFEKSARRSVGRLLRSGRIRPCSIRA